MIRNRDIFPYLCLQLRRNLFTIPLCQNLYLYQDMHHVAKEPLNQSLLNPEQKFFLQPRINFKKILELKSNYENSISKRFSNPHYLNYNIISLTEFYELIDAIPIYLKLKKDYEKTSKMGKAIRFSSPFANELRKKLRSNQEKVFALGLKLPNLIHDDLLTNYVNDFAPNHNDSPIYLDSYNVPQTNYIAMDADAVDPLLNIEVEDRLYCHFRDITQECGSDSIVGRAFYNPISAPDFIKRDIVEICNVPHQSNDDDIALNVGSRNYVNPDSPDAKESHSSPKQTNLALTPSPLYPFLALFIRSALLSHDFPLHFFNTGNLYQSVPCLSGSAYGSKIPYQTRYAGLFSISQDRDQMAESLEQIYLHVKAFYTSLGVPFNVTRCEPWELEGAESLRVNFNLLLPRSQPSADTPDSYVKCGYVAVIDDHLSQRLAIMAKSDHVSQVESSRDITTGEGGTVGPNKKLSSYYFLHSLYGQIGNVPLIAHALRTYKLG